MFTAVVVSPRTEESSSPKLEGAWTAGQVRSKRDFIDGLGNTILVIEIDNSTIRWDEPRDLSPEELLANRGTDGPNALGTPHIAIVHALFADGTVKCIQQTNSDETWRRMLLRNDGQILVESDF